jgi:hypothetical protein
MGYSEYSHGVLGVLTVVLGVLTVVLGVLTWGIRSIHSGVTLGARAQPDAARRATCWCKVSLDTFNVGGAKRKPQTLAGGHACLH